MKITYRCQICGEPILTNNGVVEHIKFAHNIQVQEYYDKFCKKEGEGQCKNCGKPTEFNSFKYGYHVYCCKNCSIAYNKNLHGENCELECKECNFTISSTTHQKLGIKFAAHLKTHHMTLKEYYDKHLKKPGEGVCSMCGNPTTFKNFFIGYHETCSKTCKARNLRKQELAEERKFKDEKNTIKISKEEEYKNYLQELKDRVHQFDWYGERNTWAGGNLPKQKSNKDDLLTDNTMTYIDGQEYSSNTQTLTNNDELPLNQQFWL